MIYERVIKSQNMDISINFSVCCNYEDNVYCPYINRNILSSFITNFEDCMYSDINCHTSIVLVFREHPLFQFLIKVYKGHSTIDFIMQCISNDENC